MKPYISQDLLDDLGETLVEGFTKPIWPTLLKRETPAQYQWRKLEILPGRVDFEIHTPSISGGTNVWMKTLCGDWDE